MQQVREVQLELVPTAAKTSEIWLEANHLAVIADADEQNAAVVVREGSDGLHHHIFELLVHGLLPNVPAQGLFEL